MFEYFSEILNNPSSLVQTAFYVVSPIVTFLAVGTAYLALYRQSKPLILVYYEPSTDVGSIIDLVICNHGNGAARNIKFSEPIPMRCWGIEAPEKIDESAFMHYEIPILVAGKELRYDGGQYGGLFSVIGDNKVITAAYEYRTPLRSRKFSKDSSFLDIRYMQMMTARNSAAQDLSDAMKGRNQTVFAKMNEKLTSIDMSLSQMAKVVKDEYDQKQDE
jgi:hypothetical protein